MPFLAGAGILSGGALATKAAIDLIPGLKESIGYTPEAIAEGESFNLNKPDSYKDDLGDNLRALRTGISTKQVKDAARQQAIDAVNTSLRTDIKQIKQGYTNLGYKDRMPINLGYREGEGTSEASLRVQDELKKLNSLQNLKASYPGLAVDGLLGKSSYELDAEGERFRKSQKGSPESRAERQEGRLLEDRSKEQSRYLDLMEQNLANRQFQQSQAQNNFQLQMGQMGMNNRRLDMENARSNRRDQREALALILQGLGNVSNNLVNY